MRAWLKVHHILMGINRSDSHHPHRVRRRYQSDIDWSYACRLTVRSMRKLVKASEKKHAKSCGQGEIVVTANSGVLTQKRLRPKISSSKPFPKEATARAGR